MKIAIWNDRQFTFTPYSAADLTNITTNIPINNDYKLQYKIGQIHVDIFIICVDIIRQKYYIRMDIFYDLCGYGIFQY